MRKPTIALVAIAAAFVLLAFVLRSGDSVDAGDAGDTGDSVDSGVPTPSTTSTTDPTTSAPITTAPSTATALPTDVAVCDLYPGIARSGQVESPDLVEASGLAASRTTSDVLWSHNDSRGGAALFALTPTGGDLGVYDVPGAFALDWEDMSAGPGPGGDGAYLYIGDIGDNFDIRGGLVTVYRVPDADPASLDGAFGESTAMTYQYPNGGHNAEALFIDPIEPALYLVTKAHEVAFVFRGSLTPSDGPGDLDLVATLFLGGEVSGADMSLDGSTFAMRGYQSVWMWHRDTRISVAEMLTEEPCMAPSPEERQGEAITFDSDLSYWTVSEGSNSAFQVVNREP